jgi:glucoamylase
LKPILGIVFFALTACASKPGLTSWVADQEARSWRWLQQNISPTEPKTPGGPKPRRGIVVAALHKRDPDYYFHWVRDSANVMRVFAERAQAQGDPPLHERMRDFLNLSSDLQMLHSPYGMGEPRFTVEGRVDSLPWSRPQYDGPALRALAVQTYLKQNNLPPELRGLAQKVLRRDLEFIGAVKDRRGFDLWEELLAENYHTRLVQMAALENGGYAQLAAKLRADLDRHWDPAKGYYRSQLEIERTDGYTKKNTDLDSAVVVAVIESGRWFGPHSVSDPKIQATVQQLEVLFRKSYPLNRDGAGGLVYGRYAGDVYYGGNPWYLVTAYYAQFYFRLARAYVRSDLRIESENSAFVIDLLSRPDLHQGSLGVGTSDHREFFGGLRE